MSERIYLSAPHMGHLEQEYIKEAFDTNWVSPLGPHLDKLEEEISRYIGVRGAAVLSSGTAAIHLALRLLEIQPGDHVFCSSFTFVGSTNPILYEGATPVLIDSDWATWNMSAAALARALEIAASRDALPKAIIIVNLYGQSADMKPLMALAEKYRVPVIEDAAESLGAVYDQRKSGGFGRFGILSLNGNKIITSSGGGVLLSNDLAALEKARFLATQARDKAPHYQHSEIGYNYRLSNICAAIGRGQLAVLEDRVKARRQVFERYEKAFGGSGIQFMPELPGSRSTRWLTVLYMDPTVLSTRPATVIDALAAQNIEARRLWKPMHLQPLFKDASYYSDQPEQSVSDQLFENGICLPSGSNLTEEQQSRVIRCVKECLK